MNPCVNCSGSRPPKKLKSKVQIKSWSCRFVTRQNKFLKVSYRVGFGVGSGSGWGWSRDPSSGLRMSMLTGSRLARSTTLLMSMPLPMPMPNKSTFNETFCSLFPWEKKNIAALVMSIGKFKRELAVLRQVSLCTPFLSGPSTTWWSWYLNLDPILSSSFDRIKFK